MRERLITSRANLARLCAYLPPIIYPTFIFNLSLCIKKKNLLEARKSSARGKEERGGEKRSCCEEATTEKREKRPVRRHGDSISGGKSMPSPKIALRGNGTHSMPRKRSIARQVIGVVKNGVREEAREASENARHESIHLQRNDRRPRSPRGSEIAIDINNRKRCRYSLCERPIPVSALNAVGGAQTRLPKATYERGTAREIQLQNINCKILTKYTLHAYFFTILSKTWH